MATNLPAIQVQDSAARTKLFFDTYGETPLEFNAAEVDAAINFFEKKGFSGEAAQVTSTTILKQAKLENLSVFEILDGLGNLEQLDISSLVGEILNNNRPSTSVLGYKKPVNSITKTRNILP